MMMSSLSGAVAQLRLGSDLGALHCQGGADRGLALKALLEQ